jgi:hypothetical protein
MTYAYLAHTAASAGNGGALAATADNMFAIMTLNAELSDPDAIVSVSGNSFVLGTTGTYQIDGTVAYGYDSAMNGVNFKAGLYNVTAGSFVVQKGGSDEILSTAGVAPDPASGTASAFVSIVGRFDVGTAPSTYAIYGAGKATATTWYSTSYAQGAPAFGVSTGSKPEYYKLFQITKE